jgi:hypothetical protein
MHAHTHTHTLFSLPWQLSSRQMPGTRRTTLREKGDASSEFRGQQRGPRPRSREGRPFAGMTRSP